MNKKNGFLIILSAPSGAGKSTIIENLPANDFKLKFSVSACNRKPRCGEKNGVDYYFLSTEEFQKHINNNDFIEWEEVYEGRYYGTLKSELNRIFKDGNNVIFDIDIAGGLNLKKQYGERALAIFIMPPSVNELERRLRDRGTETDEDIKKRIDKANYEISRASEFDVIVINEKIEKAVDLVKKEISKFLEKL